MFVGFSLDYKDDSVENLIPLKEKLDNPDHTVLYKTCSDLTKVHLRLPVCLSAPLCLSCLSVCLSDVSCVCAYVLFSVAQSCILIHSFSFVFPSLPVRDLLSISW